MTTITPFVPSTIAPFSFQPTLDGQVYTVTALWSLFGQRYFLNCSDLTGNLVFYLPLIGSSPALQVQDASWFPNTVTLTTVSPHGYQIGVPINVNVSGMVPTAFNGNYQALAINATQMTYEIDSNPGSLVQQGTVSYDINLAAGYFDSTLVYRTQNMQFEISP